MILLNPGPVNVSPRVRAALARGDICHREPEFADLQTSIRARLVQAFTPEDDFRAVLITGSGTAALEAAVTSILSDRGRLVVVSNGVYGERIAAMAAAARLPHTVVSSGWTEPPDLGAVERALGEPDVEAVAVVHHETTTGLLNPVAEVARLARRHGKLVLVDSVSGLGGDALDPGALDLVVGTGGKCIQAFPGIGFVLVRGDVMARLATHPRRSLYLSLPVHHEAQERHSVPFTPAVQLAYALDEALAELLEEGVAARIRRYAAAADLLRRGFARLDLGFVLPSERRSNSITALWLPAGRTYAALHDGLRQRGFVIYEGQGRLAREIFRVANMGHLASADFDCFLAALAGPVLVMDADVLCAPAMIERLVRSPHRNCFLLDGSVEPTGEEQMLLVRGERVLNIVRGGAPGYELAGESVGFLKLSAGAARVLRELLDVRVAAGHTGIEHEETYPELCERVAVGFERVDGMPWTEIDFPDDVARAERDVLPRIEPR